MLFTPCECCGKLMNDKEFDRSLKLSEKMFDSPKNICYECLMQYKEEPNQLNG